MDIAEEFIGGESDVESDAIAIRASTVRAFETDADIVVGGIFPIDDSARNATIAHEIPWGFHEDEVIWIHDNTEVINAGRGGGTVVFYFIHGTGIWTVGRDEGAGTEGIGGGEVELNDVS